jgi:hypothetical protein
VKEVDPLLQGKIIAKRVKMHRFFLNKIFSKTNRLMSSNLALIILG